MDCLNATETCCNNFFLKYVVSIWVTTALTTTDSYQVASGKQPWVTTLSQNYLYETLYTAFGCSSNQLIPGCF